MDTHKHPKRDEHIVEVLGFLTEEVQENYSKYPCCHPSIEHSLTVLREEVDELVEAISEKSRYRSMPDILEEAMDVAHCAIRLVVDHKCREADGLKHWEHYAKV